MESYSNFIGIDIGKFSFVVSHLGSKKTNEFNNDDSGIALFIKEYSSQLEPTFPRSPGRFHKFDKQLHQIV